MAYEGAASSGGPRWAIPEKFMGWDIDHTRFEMKRILGKGSYGSVAEALDHSHDPPMRVAIKRIPNVFDVHENAKRIFREISILRVLRHMNVTGILHLQRPPDLVTFKDLYIVFEALDTDMAKLVRDDTQNLTLPHVRWFLYQMLLGIKFVHSANVIHRDLKPANILLTEACDLKICDFGLARGMEAVIDEDAAESLAAVSGTGPSTDAAGGASSSSGAAAAGGASAAASSSGAADGKAGEPRPIARQMTKHVVTRWYRAPELPLYNDGRYTVAIDVWSIGCIMAEMLSMLDSGRPREEQKRRALFPGGSCYPLSKGSQRKDRSHNKRDQLHVIFSVMGTPTPEEIARVRTPEARAALESLEPLPPASLEERFPTADEPALDLLRRFLRFLPEDRISVDEALAHPFLAEVRRPDDEVVCPVKVEFPEVTKANIRDLIVHEIAQYNPDIPSDWRARGIR